MKAVYEKARGRPKSRLAEKRSARVFFLEALCIVPDGLAEDGSFEIYSRDCGVYSSVRKAESAMNKIFLDRPADEVFGGPLLGFMLHEKAVDEGRTGPWSEVSEFKSVRSYRPNGQLFCVSEGGGACEIPFAGRKTPAPFKAGDYAYVYSGRSAAPALISAVPYTKKEWRAKLPRCTGDYTDDSYTAYSARCGGHFHPFAPLVFPAPFPVTLKMKKSILKAKREEAYRFKAFKGREASGKA